MKNTLPIHEVFAAFQGEGEHAGRPAFFIRTQGCPVHCDFCDSAGTWHPNHVPKRVGRRTVEELAETASEYRAAEFAVVTGGEPCIHNLEPLVVALHQAGLICHLETSGAFGITGAFDWVTVSPKMAPGVDIGQVDLSLMKADEVKLIITKPEDVKMWLDRVAPHVPTGCEVWLHPEWGHRNDPAVLAAICGAVTGGPYAGLHGTIRPRAGFQLHKLYNVDKMDKRSAAPAPLGGVGDNY